MFQHSFLTIWLFANSTFSAQELPIRFFQLLISALRMLGDIRDLVERYGKDDTHDVDKPSAGVMAQSGRASQEYPVFETVSELPIILTATNG